MTYSVLKVYLFYWIFLQVCSMAYTTSYDPRNRQQYHELLEKFAQKICAIHPEFAKKPKIHLLQHLPEDMDDLGPATGFSTERLGIQLM